MSNNNLECYSIIANFRYFLTEETKEALKTLQFDVWQWEPNEVGHVKYIGKVPDEMKMGRLLTFLVLYNSP